MPADAQSPPQPVKVSPPDGVAVRKTVVTLPKLSLQSLPQLIVPSLLVIVPEPVPDLATVSGPKVAELLNEAETTFAPSIVSVQVGEVPLHDPPQPLKVCPLAAVAVSTTVVPLAMLLVQLPGQLMPDGELLTVPLPEAVTSSV